jgi:hypothetical protein
LGKDETLFSGSEIIDRQYRMTAALMSRQAEKEKEPLPELTQHVASDEGAASKYASEGGVEATAEEATEGGGGLTFDP